MVSPTSRCIRQVLSNQSVALRAAALHSLDQKPHPSAAARLIGMLELWRLFDRAREYERCSGLRRCSRSALQCTCVSSSHNELLLGRQWTGDWQCSHPPPMTMTSGTPAARQWPYTRLFRRSRPDRVRDSLPCIFHDWAPRLYQGTWRVLTH
jgi:hypothetical protein